MPEPEELRKQEIVRLCIEQPFALFHASVTFCILRKILCRDKGFNAGFFKLYVLQTVVDLVVYYSVTCVQRSGWVGRTWRLKKLVLLTAK